MLKRTALVVLVLSVVSACSPASPPIQSSAFDSSSSGPPGDGPSGAPALAPAYPAPATNAADRVGVYSWGTDFSSYVPGTVDRLTWTAQKVSAIGSRVIRIAMSPSDPYMVNPQGTFSLAAAAASQAYDQLFRNPQFDVYLLTAYSVADSESLWLNGFSDADAAAETAEVAKLTQYLSASYPAKTFIILNWEGDNAVSYGSDQDVALQGFTDWMTSRAAGVAQGRAASAGGNVYSGLEFNLLRTRSTNAPCDNGANKCVISYAAPRVSVDYYSYSSYQSFGVGIQDSQIVAQMTSDLNAALGWIQSTHPAVSANRMLLGEFGLAREDWDECDAALRASNIIQFVLGWGAEYAIYWQIIDNSISTPELAHGFGLYKSDGTISQTGDLFASYYGTGSLHVPPSTCPTTAAFVNGVTYQASFQPTTTATLFGAFDPAGNIVYFRQGTLQWWLSATNGANWYESTSQINVQLPTGIPTNEQAIVYVTSHGLDSNFQVFTVSSLCGDGSCESGETDSSCPVDCCGAATPCDTIRAGTAGSSAEYCRAMSSMGLGASYQWITVAGAAVYCDEPGDICQSTYQCGGTNGVCKSIPNGWVEEPTTCP